MNECRACGATSHLHYFDPETSAFANGSRLGEGALLCDSCVGATSLRRTRTMPAALPAGSRREPASAPR